jgi:hypothetical protein
LWRGGNSTSWLIVGGSAVRCMFWGITAGNSSRQALSHSSILILFRLFPSSYAFSRQTAMISISTSSWAKIRTCQVRTSHIHAESQPNHLSFLPFLCQWHELRKYTLDFRLNYQVASRQWHRMPENTILTPSTNNLARLLPVRLGRPTVLQVGDQEQGTESGLSTNNALAGFSNSWIRGLELGVITTYMRVCRGLKLAHLIAFTTNYQVPSNCFWVYHLTFDSLQFFHVL